MARNLMRSDILALQRKADHAERAGDYESAFQTWRKAASELGTPASYCQLGRLAQKAKK
jgi:hypothetical protein